MKLKLSLLFLLFYSACILVLFSNDQADEWFFFNAKDLATEWNNRNLPEYPDESKIKNILGKRMFGYLKDFIKEVNNSETPEQFSKYYWSEIVRIEYPYMPFWIVCPSVKLKKIEKKCKDIACDMKLSSEIREKALEVLNTNGMPGHISFVIEYFKKYYPEKPFHDKKVVSYLSPALLNGGAKLYDLDLDLNKIALFLDEVNYSENKDYIMDLLVVLSYNQCQENKLFFLYKKIYDQCGNIDISNCVVSSLIRRHEIKKIKCIDLVKTWVPSIKSTALSQWSIGLEYTRLLERDDAKKVLIENVSLKYDINSYDDNNLFLVHDAARELLYQGFWSAKEYLQFMVKQQGVNIFNVMFCVKYNSDQALKCLINNISMFRKDIQDLDL